MSNFASAGFFGDDNESKEIELPTHIIHFTGQEVFDESDLLDAVSAEHKSFYQFWKDDTATIKDKLLPTLDETLRQFFDSEGYYDAQFKIKQTKTDVTVEVKENEPVLVNDINISSDYDITELVTFQKGDIFRAKDFIGIKSRIVSEMLKEGYCSYDLNTKAYVDLDKHKVDIKYNLKKGGICTFGNVTVYGNETIDDDIIKSRVRAREGERFNLELVKDTYDALYGLNAFDSVLMNVDRKFYNVVPVDIKVSEMEKPYHFEAGAGYDSYVGARVHGSVTKHNFFGQAQQLKLDLSWSQEEQVAILSFFKPVIWEPYGFYLDLGASGGYSNLGYDGYYEEKAFFRTYLNHVSERLDIKLGMALEAIDITERDDGQPKLPDRAYNLFLLTYPYLDVIYDARDSKLNPKYGYYLRGYGEWGIPTDSETSDYQKYLLEARGIYTVSDLTMAVVGKAGVIEIGEEVNNRGIPESKKFYAGGMYSNRAYGFREIGVITSPTTDLINGAQTWLNLMVEADYPIWGDLYGAVFSDNTMLTMDSMDFNGEIISSAGVGVRYMTPVGPLKLDVGFNVEDPSIYGIQFQIGQSF
ncbi:autotransporter assembly complex protein TamA [Sulfurovum riftiae]|uniref:autotransporter assembly complex protein TamA n=1 Tax=Sulfurovum riftiae TaxID=1630136 RepID=UPI001F4E8B61|nr:BamA/TamA family outer membrane protein [Sulfurovum riftiae]